MKTYILTSPRFDGQIILKFDLNDELTAFEIKADLSPEQRTYFFQSIPMDYDAAVELLKRPKATLKMTLQPDDLSFERFWNEYDLKVGKQKAIANWNKLSDSEKMLAIYRHAEYVKYLDRKRTAKIWPERYLSYRYFDNDWKNTK